MQVAGNIGTPCSLSWHKLRAIHVMLLTPTPISFQSTNVVACISKSSDIVNRYFMTENGICLVPEKYIEYTLRSIYKLNSSDKCAIFIFQCYNRYLNLFVFLVGMPMQIIVL